jgi:6-phosphogluconolactonase
MRQLLVLVWHVALAVVALSAQSGQPPSDRAVLPIYVGTYTDGASKGIYRLEFDPAGGRLSEPALVAELANPSFLAWHPTRDLLYAVSETNTQGADKAGAVAALSAGSDGRLTRINEQPSGGAFPCYISVNGDGTHVFVANYGGGSVAAFPIQPDGGVGPPSSVVRHSGSSVNAARQRQPHAHAIVPVPAAPFVLAADLGIDRVLVYRFDRERGSLTPHAPPGVAAAPGAGPRHLTLHPAGDTVFVMNELQSTVTSHRWDAARGVLQPAAESVSTLPADFTGSNSTAEVAIHPSGRFVYGSNRGHDSIAVFRVNADRSLTRVAVHPTGGRQPRHFAIDPAGGFLVAANQKSDSIVVFRIDPQTGALSDTGVRARVPTPVCVRFKPRR